MSLRPTEVLRLARRVRRGDVEHERAVESAREDYDDAQGDRLIEAGEYLRSMLRADDEYTAERGSALTEYRESVEDDA